MIKQVNVTFDFDTDNDSVTNVQCSVDGVEKKKRTTKSKKDVVIEMEDVELVTLESGKLVFNNKAAFIMELEHEDRVAIKWESIDNILTPTILKDESGNKVTKTNTVAYKGKANAILADFGTEFRLELIRENVWKLVSTSKSEVVTLEEVIDDSEDTLADLLVDDEENVEINLFKL